MSITNKNNQLELQILTRGLRRAQGFRLFFAQCNNRQLRTHIIKELESELIKQGITLHHLYLEHPVRSLDDLVPSSLEPGQKQVVSITGLENSLPLSEEKGDILQRLSYGRDLLPKIVPVPLIIWLSSGILKEIQTESHDFWSWRAGVFHFQASPPKIETSFTEIYRDLLNTGNSIQPMDNERMHILYDLLENLNLLPDTEKNKLQRAELLRQLGELHQVRSEYKRAEINFEEYLRILKEIGEDSRLLDAYYQLGTTKMLLSKSNEATTLFETALHHCGENKKMKGYLHFLIGLEKRSKNIVEARKNFQQSLTFSREAGDKGLESTLLGIFAELGKPGR
jgi:tetratricopeptide (TPR) repeat protein